MNDNVMREQSVSSMEQDLSSSRQTSLPAQDTSSWGTSAPSAGLGTFDFTSAPGDVSIPSFDPAIAAFADLSFTQPSNGSAFPRGQGPVAAPQADAFLGRDFHDKKRMKVESDTPALDSIDYWISFDDDLDKMGSFEIDYSKRPDLLSQNRPGMASDSTPGLGSGLYSTSTAPFREEDFFDDSAFEQVLSDDEEMFESTAKPYQKMTQLEDASASRQSLNSDSALFNRSQGSDKFQPGLRLAPTVKNAPRQMRRSVGAQSSEMDIEEQKRFLEEAIGSGRIPGALIPPNGFGIGFGAGMGCRPPQEFEHRPLSPSSKPGEGQGKSRSTASARNSEASEEPESKRPTKRAASTTTKASGSRKPSSAGAPKVRSADRIAHNDVERKYRTNLKDKIAELRAAVPALHTSGGDDSEDGTASGTQSNAKISKGTVLTKATEYIHQLEARNKNIMQEHQQLARRLQAFETLLNSTGRQTDMMMPNHSMTLFDPRGFC